VSTESSPVPDHEAALSAEGPWEDAYREAVAKLDAVEAEFDALAADDSPDDTVGSLNDFPGFRQAAPSPLSTPASDAEAVPVVETATGGRLGPMQVLEAALFVGGEALSTKKLTTVLGDGFDREFVEQCLHELNLRYDAERRPYEIRLVEGGWQMTLRPEFEPVRHKVFGYGPKEIRLSQEALEVLALVAYRQPITREQLESTCGSKPQGVLGQLLRRELVSLTRHADDPKQVSYRTTPRFLQVFGLGSLDELPQADDLYFK
jgi:segregation and condensation protein B